MTDLQQAIAQVLQNSNKRLFATVCGNLPPGKPIPPDTSSHTHNHREILFVLDGECSYQLGNYCYDINPGDAVFIDTWQPHGFYYQQHDRNLQHLWMQIRGQNMSSIHYTALDHSGKITRKLLYVDASKVAIHLMLTYWDRARFSDTENRQFFARQLELSFELVLNEILFAYLRDEKVNQRSKSEDIVDYIADYIETNHGKDCSLAQLEKLSGYTHCYLSHLFRKHYGKTIGEAINEARMQYVIDQSWMASSKDIADELGFSSVVTFWRWRRNNRHLETVMTRESAGHSDSPRIKILL